ncbi:MAG: hypothetical protein IJK04_10025, partial [Kiritimatiellae bacterium]|nr:hypothetical protein [Kiritimatiellia bacterium]
MRTAVERDVPEESEEVPPAVNAALKKALSKDPKERFGNCAEFVEAMSHAPQGKDGSRGVLAPPDAVTPWERGHPARGTSDTPKRHSLWPWLLAGAAAFALGLGLWRTGATGGESDPPATPPGGPTAVSAAPPVTEPTPSVTSDSPSGGPTAVSAATSGGVATATSTVSTAAPVLPPATATRAELEDALAQLESRRDALASQGYAVEDLERKPVEEALGQP